MSKTSQWLLGSALAMFSIALGYAAVIYGDWIDEKILRLVVVPAILLLGFIFLFDKTKLFLVIILIRGGIDSLIDATRIGPLSMGAAMNALILLIALLFIAEKPRPAAKVIFPMWLPLVIVMLFQAARNPELGTGIKTVLGYITNAAIFAIPFYLKECKKDFKFCAWLIICSSILPAFYVFPEYAKLTPDFSVDGRIRSVFPHPNIFAFYLVVVILLTCYVIKSKVVNATRLQRWTLAFYMLILLTGLLLTQTRSAWVACALIFVVYGVLFERTYLVYIFVAALVASTLPVFRERLVDLDTGPAYWTNNAPLNSYDWRKMIWEAGLGWMKPIDYPLGLGQGSFQRNSEEFFVWAVKGGSGAHNVYVQWFFEAGVVGVACASWLYYRIFNLVRRNFSQDKLGGFVTIAIIVQYLVCAFSDNMLDYLAFNWYFWFFVGTACSIAFHRDEPEEPQARRDLSVARP